MGSKRGPRQPSRSAGARTWQQKGPGQEPGLLLLHLRLGECSIITIAAFTSGVVFILRGCTHPTQHKSKFWLCDLGGVAVEKLENFCATQWGRGENNYFTKGHRPSVKYSFSPETGQEGRFLPVVWFATPDSSLCGKPNSFIIKSKTWKDLHFSLAIIPDKFLEHNEPKTYSSEYLNYSW